MSFPQKASPAVLVSGILEIIGSALAALCVVIALLGTSVLPATPAAAQLPPAAKMFLQIFLLIFFAISALGIATGIYLIRLKNWARIVTIIWAGFTSLVCGLIIVVFLFVQIPVTPGQPPQFEQMARVMVVAIYGIPLALGIWWLVLFNTKSVADQFTGSYLTAQLSSTLPGGSYPSAVLPPAASKPTCPLPVAVVAVLLILSALSFVFVIFLRSPAILFGKAIHGPAGIVFWILSCGLSVAAGVGLLRLKPWSYMLAIGMQVFWLCSGTFTVFSRNYESLMLESLKMSPFTSKQVFTPEYVHNLKYYSYIGLAGSLIILGILIYYRGRFDEAAAA